MIRVNLLPFKEARRVAAVRREVTLFAFVMLLGLVAAVLASAVQGRRTAALQGTLAEVEREVGALRATHSEIVRMERKKKDLSEKLDALRSLRGKRLGPVRVLDDLSRSVPEQLWLTEFVEKQGGFTVTGSAVDNQTIAAFMRALAASRYFRNVDLVETVQEAASLPAERGRRARPTSPTAGEEPLQIQKFAIKGQVDYLGRAGREVGAPAAAAKE